MKPTKIECTYTLYSKLPMLVGAAIAIDIDIAIDIAECGHCDDRRRNLGVSGTREC